MNDDYVEEFDPCEECREKEGHLYRDEHGDLVYRCYDCPLRPGDWWDC